MSHVALGQDSRPKKDVKRVKNLWFSMVIHGSFLVIPMKYMG